jgi:hypothetical protein
MNSNKRIAATVYSLGTFFVSGIYVQIPCIKEIMTIIIIIIFINCNWLSLGGSGYFTCIQVYEADY